MSEPPQGTVTLLFTDIEGSTQMARRLGEAWDAVLETHHACVSGAIEAHRGWVERTEGDAFFAVFQDAAGAVAAAADAQRRLRAECWPAAAGELRVRMGVHTGDVRHGSTGYVGLEVHRAARVAAAANGGQVLITAATRAMLPAETAADDLGEHRLKDFPAPERLFHLVVDGERAAAFPSPRTLAVRPTNLPPPMRPLVGREAELETVRAAFLADGAQLVTLTGRGGAGKTSLALVAARALLDEHPGGAWIVRLASAQSADRIVPAIAEALGVPDSAGTDLLAAIAAATGERPTLVLLDNLEHLAGAAHVVAALCDAAPQVRVLATSQAPLRLSTERVVTVGPLPSDDAAALFTARAAAAGLSLPDAEHTTVAAICEQLDGVPLALELAAARLSVLTPAQLLERLDHALDLLRRGPEDLPERQRSLRATIEWTLSLLDPEARELFARLAVFAAPVPLETVEAVCDDGEIDVLDAVAALLDLSLLRRIEEGGGVVRLGLPQALREAALERLREGGEEDRWQRAHVAHLVEELHLLRWAFYSSQVQNESVRANVRAALNWARGNEPALHSALVACVATPWLMQGLLREATSMIDAALTGAWASTADRAVLLTARAHRLGVADDPAALDAADEALALVEDPTDRSYVLAIRSFAAYRTRPDEALASARAAAELARMLQNRDALLLALVFEAQTLMRVGRLEEAGRVLDEADTLVSSLPPATLARLTSRGDLALLQQEWLAAIHAFAGSVEIAGRAGLRYQRQWDLTALAVALAGLGADHASVEVAALAALEGREIGDAFDPARLMESAPGRLAAARAAVGAEAVAAIEAGAGTLAPHERAPRALTVAREAAGPELTRREEARPVP